MSLLDYYAEPKRVPGGGAARALELLAAIEQARLAAAAFVQEYGALPDGIEESVAVAQAEAALAEYDAAHGLPLRSYVRDVSRPYGGRP